MPIDPNPSSNPEPAPPAAPRRPSLMPPPHAITIEIDQHQLRGYSDEFLATAWYVAQANPAPFGDRPAGELVQHIGWEIIRRWLGKQDPPLYSHQPQHHYADALRQLARYKPGGESGTLDWYRGTWEALPAGDAAAAVNGAEAGR